MKIPNLFDHARSELAQDAVLAYILEWAKPELRQHNPQLHELGNRLLREMLKRCNAGRVDVHTLQVKTQESRVDVQVVINDKIVIFIEDKISGSLHSNQIERYRERLKADDNKADNNPVYALYVKTGNESCTKRPHNADGQMYRQDLLEILGIHPVGDTIVDQFREHLQNMEDETKSFRHQPVSDWSRHAVEGYYMTLEKHLGLCGEQCSNGEQRSNLERMYPEGWDYSPNPKGGFLGFWWHYRRVRIDDTICALYLQIENATKLTARLGYCVSPEGKGQKTVTKQLWTVFHWLQEHARTVPGLQIQKVARFHPGRTSAVAVLGFPSGVVSDELTYLATDKDGRLDMEKTLQHLDTAMELVDTVSGSHAP